jgi:hypothetical protein
MMLSCASKGSMPNPYRTLNSTQVLGMICINPRAPFGDMARPSPALSSCMTARIHCAGIANRRDASVMKDAKDSTPDARVERDLGTGGSPPALASDNNAVATSAPERRTPKRRSRRPAVTFATVLGEANLRRPRGRAGASFHAITVPGQPSVGERCCARLNRGETEGTD